MAGWGFSKVQGRRTQGLLVGGSVAAHLLMLLALDLTAARPAFRLPDPPPPVELRLIRPQRAPVQTHLTTTAPATSHRASATPSAAPLEPHTALALPLATATPPVATPVPMAAAGSSPPTDNGSGVRAMLRGTLGCDYGAAARLTEEEKGACARRFAARAAKASPFSGIDPAKRSVWDQQLAEKAARRDGTQAQADLKALQDARGPAGPSRKFDINGGFNCKLTFGANAKPGLGSLACKGSPPDMPSH